MNNSTVVRMLRLFNLCDLGTASTESPSATKVVVASPSRIPHNPSAALHWVMPLRCLCVSVNLLNITQSHQPLSAQTFATSSAVYLICMRAWPTAQSSSGTIHGGDSGSVRTLCGALQAANSEASSRSIGGTFSGAPAASHSAQNSDGSHDDVVEHHSKRLRTNRGDYSPRSRSPSKAERCCRRPNHIFPYVGDYFARQSESCIGVLSPGAIFSLARCAR